jgi:hypothetical protein
VFQERFPNDDVPCQSQCREKQVDGEVHVALARLAGRFQLRDQCDTGAEISTVEFELASLSVRACAGMEAPRLARTRSATGGLGLAGPLLHASGAPRARSSSITAPPRKAVSIQPLVSTDTPVPEPAPAEPASVLSVSEVTSALHELNLLRHIALLFLLLFLSQLLPRMHRLLQLTSSPPSTDMNNSAYTTPSNVLRME